MRSGHRAQRGIARIAILLAVGVFVLLGVPASTADATNPLSGLSFRQWAGQRVIYSYPGLTPPASLLNRIRNGAAAGVIFFSANISSAAQITAVVRDLRAAAAQSPVPVPLLLMIDQEGGEVRRLPGAPVPAEKRIGQAGDPVAVARQAAAAVGRDLVGVGMNVNLAPVLDVYRRPGDFLDRYQRSYGTNPNQVATLGAAFINTQQPIGVAAAAKHFPGLGAASADEDTDIEPVTLPVPLSTLRGTDELPYRAAISAGVKLVMLSWATYPALDPHRPAGLSSVVVQQELRNRLGFPGVTVTDALEAGALRAYGSDAQRAVLAARAGMDLVLCSSGDVHEGDDAAEGLAAALASGGLDRAGFAAAIGRVLALRAHSG